LGDGDDVDAFAAQAMKGATGDAGSAAHVFSHHRDDGDVGVHGDVVDDLVSEVLGEFAAKGFERFLRVGFGDDEADVILRRRLRNQQHFGAELRGSGKGAADHVRHADDSRTADADQRNVADRGERLDSPANATSLRG